MRENLTEKQKNFFEYLKQVVGKTGAAPSLRKAAAELGISHAAVAQMLKMLEGKGCIKREGRYSRTIHILNHMGGETVSLNRLIKVPIIGQITAGLPMYAQQEWDGSVVVDSKIYRGDNLFALRVKGASMKNAGILDNDLAICEPRQFAQNNEIVAALINNEEATIKRFFLHKNYIELKPENLDFSSQRYEFNEVLIQGKLVGIVRGEIA
ncbi:MAG: transcriptional repressor LexA [Desulfobacteraceae bacterium]|nr:transcriptional repressor LexA [Desulfobacteraceae bacterium]